MLFSHERIEENVTTADGGPRRKEGRKEGRNEHSTGFSFPRSVSLAQLLRPRASVGGSVLSKNRQLTHSPRRGGGPGEHDEDGDDDEGRMWTDADGRSSIAAEVTKLEREREFALSPSILPRPARRWAQWGGNSREKEKQPGSGREGRKKGGERERDVGNRTGRKLAE